MEHEIMRTWAEVNLANIRYNVSVMKSALPRDTRFLGIVKANAYGHGAVPCARTILEAGADYLAVACLSEAVELRENDISAPILILGVTPHEHAEILAEYGLTQSVSSLEYARRLSRTLTRPLKVHMKLDTGMSRTGFNTTHSDRFCEIEEALRLPNLDYEGVFTHFAVSDCPGDTFTATQFERFTKTIARAEGSWGHRFEIRHCANSGAIINYRDYALDMVRPGVMTYGMYPGLERGGIYLRPAMQVKSHIYDLTEHYPGDTVSYGRTFTADRTMRLAVVPIGYADGLHRVLSGKMDMLVHGRRCRQVGRICMDMCMVDVTDVPGCRRGDVVTVIGTDGDETILADELAEKAGTINYEITCDFTSRVPRIYI